MFCVENMYKDMAKGLFCILTFLNINFSKQAVTLVLMSLVSRGDMFSLAVTANADVLSLEQIIAE